MTKILQAAVIGYGYGGRVFHAAPIARTEGMQLAAIVSSRTEEIGRNHPGVAVVTDPQTVFDDPAIDLIAISTPNTSHFDLAARALAAGKHVSVDKPFTVNTGEARELADLAKKAGRLLTVFHNFRHYSDFLALKKLLADGTLGDIAYLESHFDRWSPQVPDAWREKPGPGSGTWWDLGPHLVDQVLQLFGRPRAVTADMAVQRPGGATVDYFHVLLRYERLRVVLTSCFLAAEENIRFVVHGSKASFLKRGIDTRDGPDRWPGTLVFDDGSQQAVAAAIADERSFYRALRDAILTGGPNPVALEEAIAVMEILEAGDQSAAEKREVAL